MRGGTVSGVWALGLGIVGLFAFVPSWLANPCFLISFLFSFRSKGSRKTQLVWAWLAVLLGLTVLLLPGQTVGSTSGWYSAHFYRLRFGSFIWLGGFVLLAFWSTVEFNREQATISGSVLQLGGSAT